MRREVLERPPRPHLSLVEPVAARRPVVERSPALSLSVVILTFNEEVHIERAIASVAGIASEIVVVDSFSKDRTVMLAEAAGARVLQHPFVNQAKQFNWALEHAGITSDWILRLDADELIEPDLRAEILSSLPELSTDVVGVYFKRKHIFMGRWIRHGGRYPLLMLRLWRNGHGRVEDRWMDEHVLTWGGQTITMDGGFADACLHDLSFFTDKHNKYATREAIEVLDTRYCFFPNKIKMEMNAGQAKAKRQIKEVFFNKLPLFSGPAFYFLYRYFIQLGFLDGRAGLIYHLLQGFWYRFLVKAKLVELEEAIADCANNSERLLRLKTLTGINVE